VNAAPGIEAWLAPREGPRRAYEAPRCERSPQVYADTITALQVRHALVRLIDPKHIVSGWMPRRVHVTDDDGNVVREMTAEQLGVKLIARAAVEFASDGEALPSAVCPKCGGAKSANAKTCLPCGPTARRPDLRTCPTCGGRKTSEASTCVACTRVDRARTLACRKCGFKKKSRGSRCLNCSGPPKPATSDVCPKCQGRKNLRSAICWACNMASRQAANPTKCPDCGGKKSHVSPQCRGCYLVRRRHG